MNRLVWLGILVLAWAGCSLASGVDNYIFLGHFATPAAANDACMASFSGSGFCQSSATQDDARCGPGGTLHRFSYRYGVPPDRVIINENYATACDSGYCPASYPELDAGNQACLAGCPDDGPCRGRNLGPPVCSDPDDAVGNPCRIGSGNKYQREVDLAGAPGMLDYTRHYNSLVRRDLGLGWNWTSRYVARVTDLGDSVQVIRGDGYSDYYDCTSTPCTGMADSRVVLEKDASGYTLTDAEDTVERYDAGGRLQSITDLRGNHQVFEYDVHGRLSLVSVNSTDYLLFDYNETQQLASVTDQAGRVWGYRYDTHGNLEYVDHPDGTSRRYHYNEPSYTDGSLPHALTGISDERGVRHASYAYDASGRALMATHADDAGRVDISYDDTDGTRMLVNSRGEASHYTTVTQLGRIMVSAVSGPGCSQCSEADVQYAIDPQDNRLRSRMANASVTRYGDYDTNGRYQCRVDGVSVLDGVNDECGFDGTASPAARRMDLAYDARFRSRLASIAGPSVYPGAKRVTTYTHDDHGNLLSARVAGFTPAGVAVFRETRFEYAGPARQLSRIDGPRTDIDDVTILRYHPDDAAQGSNRARLKEIEDARGVLVRHSMTYTATGRLESERDAHNVLTRYSYYPGNDRLQQVSMAGAGGTRVIAWTYEATGEVRSITIAHGSGDASTLSFTYDDARRLTRITDGLGNVIQYTLDTEGNRIEERILDNTGVLRKVLGRTFDAYNRLATTSTGGNLQAPLESRQSIYAPDGTLSGKVDGNGSVTDYHYDDLQRLLSSTRDLGGLAARTQYDYDVSDHAVEIIDPIGGKTTYEYDDLGNLLRTISPDTGVTVFTHDAAGNVISKTTASGTAEAVTVNYTYDALNRLIHLDTPEPLESVSYTYDSCPNGDGRLCTVTNGHAVVSYLYDVFGNVAAHQGLTYTYDEANRVKTITYLSGALLTYHYDLAGQVSAVDLTVNGMTRSLASSISYMPFGGIESLNYGNGKTLNQQWDSAYRLTRQDIPGALVLDLPDYDGNGNLRQRVDSTVASAVTSTFSYDALERLNSASGPIGASRAWDHDLNGNRTLMDEGLPVALTYGPDINDAMGTSNRLGTIGSEDVILDVAGNTLARGNWTYSYTTHNRLRDADNGAGIVATFVYNGLGQRVEKASSVSYTRKFLYGINGQLAVETDAHGYPLVEYFYLNGRLLAVYHPDADNNGETNLQAVENGNFAASSDTDDDGLSDIDELMMHGTSPALTDTDGDGMDDGTEILYGTDPLDANHYILPGDINLDGWTNTADYLLLMQYVLGIKSPTMTERGAADLNQDGALDVGDLLILSRTIMGLVWQALPLGKVQHALMTIRDGLFGRAEATDTQGALYFVHNDHLGSPVVMTDEGGNAVWRAMYHPFGRAVIDASSTTGLDIRFPGQYYDAETTLHYNYYRYYDPETGRYLTADPRGQLLDYSDPARQVATGAGIAIQQRSQQGYLNHHYGYARNNPVNRTDPTGEIEPLTAGLIIWGLLYVSHAGDLISDSKGNLWGTPRTQDNVCTLPFPIGGIANQCILGRCQRHDACYDMNSCTASSWIPSVLGATKSCNQCNSEFFK